MDPEPLSEAEALLFWLKLFAWVIILGGGAVALVAAVQFLVRSL
jgi:hypothetical protein